ncbi:MAG: carbohydrate binding domain-containing protein [Melioribacteraceae bacterium]|nr:carbohydrate binding domain-containing protein [Melioribacteraceae bacterium]
MKNLKIYFFFCFLISSNLFSQNFSGGFNFNLSMYDSTEQNYFPLFENYDLNGNDFISISNDGHFSFRGERIRFWGINMVADGAFPEKSVTRKITNRLKKFGVNLVRLHHVDNGWSKTGSLFTGLDTRDIDPVQLDKLEYLIYQLKRNGIFVNLNLNVSRTFSAFDGVPDADSLLEFAKGVTLFDRQLIDLQKEYASQILRHVNPYTGLSIVEDPVLAMVEMINENSMYRLWKDDKLKPIGTGGQFTTRHSKMLDSLFNSFLVGKYISNLNLITSWNKGVISSGTTNLVKNNGFEAYSLSPDWMMELHSTAKATSEIDKTTSYTGINSVKINVTVVSDQEWHMQFKQPTLSIQKDSVYSISFAAKSDSPKKISLTMSRNNDPYTWYNGFTFDLNTQWQYFTVTFKAPENNPNNTRLAFSFNNAIGTFWIDEVSIMKSGLKGLHEEENLDLRNIKRIAYKECAGYTSQRVEDISEFYAKVQSDFQNEMRNFIKNELKVKVPIVGANWGNGVLDSYFQSGMDYVDNHAYWDHPSFPNEPWSNTDWRISNTPMVKDPFGGTINTLFKPKAELNKPYTISEYNHPFPNRYQVESMVFLPTYSSFHNVDATMVFDYYGGNKWEDDFIDSYFSVGRNHLIMSMFPTAALAFRKGYIKSESNPILLNFSKEFLLSIPKTDESGWTGNTFISDGLPLTNSFRVSDYNASVTTPLNSLPIPSEGKYSSSTDEITLDTQSGLLSVDAEKYFALTGFLKNAKDNEYISAILLSVNDDDFGAISWISLDDKKLSKSELSLITITSKIQNSSMIWNGINTINNNWGKKPTQIYPMIIELELVIEADSISVIPLDNSGMELYSSSKIYKPLSDNKYKVILDQNTNRTVWFGINNYGNGLGTGLGDNYQIEYDYQLNQNYPNPFNPTTTISFSLKNNSITELKVYDLLGREVRTLIDKVELSAGNHYYSLNSEGLSSGIYFYKITAGGYNNTKKMIILK